MKIVATIEARMKSSRLPGKVLLKVLGKSMIEHLINRLKQVPSLNEIVIATTINKEDDRLEFLAKKLEVMCYRGSEEDVMARVIEAGDSCNADIIVEITGDCPIIDPQIIEQAIRIFKFNNADYVSNAHIRSYPDGMDVQVFNIKTLKRSSKMTKDPLDHEHVTLHIRNHPDIFSHIHLVAPPKDFWPELGLTLDEQKDYELLKKIMEYFGLDNPYFSCSEVIHLLKGAPEWAAINSDVIRKGDT